MFTTSIRGVRLEVEIRLTQELHDDVVLSVAFLRALAYRQAAFFPVLTAAGKLLLVELVMLQLLTDGRTDVVASGVKELCRPIASVVC